MAQGINPEVGYEFDAFRLNGGLDLTSPKIDAPKGTLLDVLNRDTIDRIGYRRINGFEPYDGRVSPAQIEYYTLTDTGYSGTLSTDFPNDTLLVVEDDPDVLFGIVVGRVSTDTIVYARINEDAEPSVGQVINGYGTTTPDFTVDSKGTYAGDDAADTVSDMNAFNTVLRNRITSLDDVPIGLHWFRDRLYAVQDDHTVYFTQSAGTTEILPNSLLSKDAGASTARVLNIQLQSGTTWAGGDAAGTLQIEVLTGAWGISGTVTVSAPTNTTEITLREKVEGTDPEPLYASLARSKSERQALLEDNDPDLAGWSRIDHGWEMDFDDGISDTNGLTVVSRGSESNFVFQTGTTDPTPVEVINGNNVLGSTFATYFRNFGGTGVVADGDPGWKTSADSTDFATNAALKSAIESTDASFAYANLWWSGSGPSAGFGIPGGALASFDQRTFGPVNTVGGASSPSGFSTETFDSDFFTGNLRAPIILKDLSSAASSIPDGSLIVGTEVIIDYSSQNYFSYNFQASRNTDVIGNTLEWIEGAFSWIASYVNINNSSESTITGEETQATLAVETTSGSYEQSSTSGTSGGFDNGAYAATITGQTATIGSSSDTLGLSGLTRTDLIDSNLGIAVYAKVVGSGTYPIGMIDFVNGSTLSSEQVFGCIRAKVDKITVRLHYTTPSARYYVGDGAGNVCSVDVVYFVRSDGSWTSGTAEGSLQFTNLVPDVDGSKRTVETGDTFHVTAGNASTGTSPVLTAASGITYNGFPSLNRIVSAASRYQFITANFFSREEWDGFYGVNGADRAFSFASFDADGDGDNEDYIIRIITNTLDEAGDTPRHIAFHHYALALGYDYGVVRFSVLGEPENFDGAFGAAEIGVGDSVTGLLSMKGTMLGVYCENSIWGIAGTDADNYQTQVLSPYNGAIEYSCVDMGVPVHCDNRGVSTLEQTEKYGNFAGRRLSYNVTPFILPRMIRNNAQFSGKGIVCAIPFRADNQYLVFFKDGKVLVMTMNPDGNPSFTYSTYYIGSGTSGNFLVPFAWSAQVDNRGVDRVHVSHFSPLSTVSDADGLKVYEINKGWGFAGEPIPEYYTVNWYYKDPFTFTTLKKIRLDGLTQGVSSCKVSLAKEYDTTFSTNSTDISLRVGQIGGTEVYTTDLVPASVMANVTERGRSMTFKVEGTNTTPIPPDIHQIVLPHFDPGGKIDS